MRIVYMLTSLGVGGTERQVLALGDRMAAKGHAVAVIALRPARPDDLPTDLCVVHLDVKKTPLGLINGLRRGAAFLRASRPEIVHSHNFHGNLLARLLRIFYRVPLLICTIHNVYEGGRRRMLAYRFTDRLATLTTAVSAAAAERYVRLKAVPEAKSMVLTNGIDTEEFIPDAKRREATRARMGVATEFVWMTSGRMAPAKDYPNLLRAFAKVRAAFPTAQLWIAGALEPTSAQQQLSDLAVEARCVNHVRWLGLRSDIPALLDAADAFVLASAWEGMPLALGEAMAMEKPVVATNVGGVRELAGDSAFIVPAKSSGALAEAMLTVMQQSLEERKATGRAARARISNHFSMDAKTDAWEEVYRSFFAPVTNR